jgi:hypothetical protein
VPHRLSISFAAASLAVAVLSPHARADNRADQLTRLRQHAEAGEWEPCTMAVYVPESNAEYTGDTVLEPLTTAVGSLAVGATPTVKALGAECLAQTKQDPDKLKRWQAGGLMTLSTLRENLQDLKEGRTYDVRSDDVIALGPRCAPVVDLAVEVLGADTKVTLADWTGAIGAAKAEICDPGAKVAAEMQEKKVGPFVKAGIKNGKMKILEQYDFGVEIGIPGGTFTLDPKALAKANPWFSESTGDDCGGGRVITHVHRYQFDKDQRLTKESTKDYCGAIPKSAYR